jgi:hypothetical protein
MSLGPEFLVNTTTSGAQFGSDNARSAGGQSVVVWNDASSSTDRTVRAQLFDRFDHKIGPELIVAHLGSTTPGAKPAVAMGPQGNFVVTWTQPNGTDTNVLAQQFTSTGQRFGGVVQVGVGTFKEHDPDVAIDAFGRFTVSYTRDTNNNNPDIFAKRFDRFGNLLNVLNVGVSSKAENLSSVAVTPDGRIDVAYQLQFSTSDDDVLMARFSASGTPLGTTSVAVSTAREQAPSVSVDDFGNAVVAYQKLVGSDFDIKARRVSSAGIAGSEINIQSTTANETAPSVALNRGGGGFVVAYNGASGATVSEVSATDAVLATFSLGFFREGPAVSIDGFGEYLLTYNSTDVFFDHNIRGRFGHL